MEHFSCDNFCLIFGWNTELYFQAGLCCRCISIQNKLILLVYSPPTAVWNWGMAGLFMDLNPSWNWWDKYLLYFFFPSELWLGYKVKTLHQDTTNTLISMDISHSIHIRKSWMSNEVNSGAVFVPHVITLHRPGKLAKGTAVAFYSRLCTYILYMNI